MVKLVDVWGVFLVVPFEKHLNQDLSLCHCGNFLFSMDW